MSKLNITLMVFISVFVYLSESVCISGGNSSFLNLGQAYAAEDWKAEFDNICSKTDTATELTKDELKDIIARCDKLNKVIETLDETTRKVYLKRLKMCKDLFIFVLESME